ncbi:MAG: hypothetical protein IT445_17290 [Phycisphaeraceae bacterium]|nr:hypothetical protein [Phycisphaeraceae bacterium]
MDESSIIGINLQLLPHDHQPWAGPYSCVVVCCPGCSFIRMIVAPVPRSEAMKAIAQLYSWGDRLAAHYRRQPQQPPTPGSPSTGSTPTGNAGRPGQVRPSLRKWQRRDAVTESEIRSFLNKLQKTSFKVDSKGFRKFLKSMGIDPDHTQEDKLDQPP